MLSYIQNIMFANEFIVSQLKIKVNWRIAMKTDKNIFIAFLLNLSFSIFELIGGILCGSVAIISDSFHDFCDAASIGISYFLEKKSKNQPDKKYTYGYTRFSVLGGFITTLVLLIGSILMIFNAVSRINSPTELDYNKMIIFAVLGVCVNFCAALITHKGNSLNQRAVNLHMLEDVLSWAVVLIGAIVMRFTDITIIDPIMSIGISIFILINAIKNLKEIMVLFLEKVPDNIDSTTIKNCIEEIDGVIEVHHLHLWSMDEQNNIAAMHVVADFNTREIKDKIRQRLREHNIFCTTIEVETSFDDCPEKHCHPCFNSDLASGHHHHHH